MSITQVIDHVYEIRLGIVNAHLIEHNDDLVLIDTGSQGDAAKIADSLGVLGFGPADLSHIFVTHCHPDHAGSLASLQLQTDATTMMHAEDAQMVRLGKSMRTLTPADRLLRFFLFHAFIRRAPHSIQPALVHQEVAHDQLIEVAGGIRVIHTPGHSAGHVSLLWEPGNVLFVGDAAMNIPWLGKSIAYENHDEATESRCKLSRLRFDVACFGHGRAILRQASAKFRRIFGD